MAAATRREALTHAVKEWRNSDPDTRDAAFEAALVEIGITKPGDVVGAFYWDYNGPNDQGVTITTIDELIYVDTAGNVSRGAAE